MQYEIVFKSDRLFMLYLPSSCCSCCCSKCSEDGCSGYWYWVAREGKSGPAGWVNWAAAIRGPSAWNWRGVSGLGWAAGFGLGLAGFWVRFSLSIFLSLFYF